MKSLDFAVLQRLSLVVEESGPKAGSRFVL